jgi:hypothetical protein
MMSSKLSKGTKALIGGHNESTQLVAKVKSGIWFNGFDLTILWYTNPISHCKKELEIMFVATSSCTDADGEADTGVW